MATPVTIERAELEPKLVLRYIFIRTLGTAVRITIVWGVIAILVPQFGITWWMVALAKIALRACRKVDTNAIVVSMNRDYAKRKPKLITAQADAELLRKRAAL